MKPWCAASNQVLAAWAKRMGLVCLAWHTGALAQVQVQRQEPFEPANASVQAVFAPSALHSKGGALIDAPPPPPPPEPEPPAHAAAWLRQVNAIRAAGASCGGQAFAPVAPLRWNAQLEQAAVLHSRDQAGRNRIGHDGSDGSGLGERIGRQGYAWQAAGENVAAGYANMAAAIVGWLNSPGHCRNMMGPQFKEMGLGQAGASGTYGAYYTMVLGAGGGGAAPSLTVAQTQERDPKAVLAMINHLRAQGGTCGKTRFLPSRPLQWDERLSRAATWDALSNVGRKAADDPGGLTERVRRAGYFSGSTSAMGTQGGEAPLVAMGSLMGSGANCADFLSDRYTHLGFAGAPESSDGRPSRWWWSLVLANDMYDGRLGPTGPVDRRRTDHAAALEVVNAFRSKGLTCKGEVMPPVPLVTTHPILETVVQAVADGRSRGPYVDWARMLSASGMDWSGGAQEFSGSSTLSPVLTIEDWVTGGECKAFLSPKLKYVGARLLPTQGNRFISWLVIVINDK